MNYIPLSDTGIMVSNIGVGCMRIASLNVKEAEAFLKTAIDTGVNFFDHADCYNGGRSEELFAEALNLNSDGRERIIIQTKCGNVDNPYGHWMYNFSKDHILEAVDGSLKRLKTDYIDVLLLHRPDPLMIPEEVAEAFEKLHESGKVKYFGVSNQNVMQMEMLQKYLKNKLIVNQIQFGVAHTPLIDQGLFVNMECPYGIDRDGGMLEYSMIKNISLQAWSPFRAGVYCEDLVIDNPKYEKINQKLEEVGNRYGVSKTTMALAWILRLPCHIMPLTGTMNVSRLKECLCASEIEISRAEWYDIYASSGHHLA